MCLYAKYPGKGLQKFNHRRISQAFFTLSIHDHTIGQVGEHMKQKLQADDIERFGEKKEYNVYDHRVVGMQRVVVNTASVGLENRVSHQVIQIYQHRRQEKQIYSFPILSKKPAGDKKGKPSC